MDEQRQEGMPNGSEQKTREMQETITEMREKVSYGINSALCNTAENLDKAADKMHKTAEFFRSKSTGSASEDLKVMAQKYPAQTLAGAAIIGFLLGRILSR